MPELALLSVLAAAGAATVVDPKVAALLLAGAVAVKLTMSLLDKSNALERLPEFLRPHVTLVLAGLVAFLQATAGGADVYEALVGFLGSVVISDKMHQTARGAAKFKARRAAIIGSTLALLLFAGCSPARADPPTELVEVALAGPAGVESAKRTGHDSITCPSVDGGFVDAGASPASDAGASLAFTVVTSSGTTSTGPTRFCAFNVATSPTVQIFTRNGQPISDGPTVCSAATGCVREFCDTSPALWRCRSNGAAQTLQVWGSSFE